MIKIGLLGFGTVNTGVYEGIKTSTDYLKDVLQEDLCISKILVRNKQKYIGEHSFELITDCADDFFKEEFDIVFEAIGGVQPAIDYVTSLINRKVPIITANKELIAKYGELLEKLAYENNVFIGYEATVAGGIPIINTLRSQLQWTTVNNISAILNGTTNYIITKLNESDYSFEEVLRDAQLKGFAEADPTSDIEGYDALYKLQILCKLCFGKWVNEEAFIRQGMTHLQNHHFEVAEALNLKLKYICNAYFDDSGIKGIISPCLLEKKHPLASIENENNGIYLQGEWLGNFVASGPGAGKKPTATSMIEDYLHQQQRKQSKTEVRKRIDKINIIDFEYVVIYKLLNETVVDSLINEQTEILKKEVIFDDGEHKAILITGSSQFFTANNNNNLSVFPFFREKASVIQRKLENEEIKISV